MSGLDAVGLQGEQSAIVGSIFDTDNLLPRCNAAALLLHGEASPIVTMYINIMSRT
ncbi:MAG: hypothetical protein MZV63_12395 [Marinilabiliales bacterium]|nr:hypothetical protein [Marinilabiliales bacterium]